MKPNQVIDKEQIKKLLALDPFIKYWADNYKENIEKRVFGWERSRPLLFLKNMMPYSHVPVVLVAAGPSLDKNLHILKDYQDKCIICCVDVVVFKLLKEGIKPDFVINIDPHPEVAIGWTDDNGNQIDTSDLVLVCPTTNSYANLTSWKGNIIFYNQSDDKRNHKGPFLEKLTRPTSGFGTIANSFFIGATMYQFASMFVPSAIILMGYDFAYTDNKPFCSGIVERKARLQVKELYGDKTTDELVAKQTEDLTKHLLQSSNLEAKVGSTGIIKTSELFRLYLNTLLGLIKIYRFPVINATEGGILVNVPNFSLKDSLNHCCKPSIKKYNIFDKGFIIASLKSRRRRRK
ncbi:MAG TPA: DUF115 domain-containing protein [Methanofastidiosum sp.]|nr:DUF115 domain-containing protein [Methanofastidiosum sp.]